MGDDAVSESGFDEQVRAARDRTAALRRRAETADGPADRAVLTEALEEMALAFEELSAAQEQLQAQNEAILTAEAVAGAERDRYRDLLDVSRIARGKLQLSLEPTDLGEAVDRAVESAADHATDRGVKLTAEPPAAAVRVLADPNRLDQVLSNLLTNAVKYTDRRGKVTLSVGADGRFGVVRVRDTGVGIAAEVLPQVFELFVQSEQSAGQSQGGLGIGLHLVRELITLHGGTVTAHSEGVGRGSEFVVRLPLVGKGEPGA